jgi:DNA repair protein RadD
MRLRPRQSLFVERSLAALCDHGNTLSIASTGFGKTIALSAVVAKSLEGSDAKACILAHRDELTAQNRAKFGRVAPEITTSVVDAEAKSWAGRATFAMVPTLSRPANLAAMGGMKAASSSSRSSAVSQSDIAARAVAMSLNWPSQPISPPRSVSTRQGWVCRSVMGSSPS